MKLTELTERIGVSARQVRYMIAEKFVPPPTGGRAHARYGDEHITAIRRYRQLRELGFTPASIRVLLQGQHGVPFPMADGITLVVAPELVASGRPAEPVATAVEAKLKQVLAPPNKPAATTTPIEGPKLRDPIEAFVARQHSLGNAAPVPLVGLGLSVTIRGALAVVEATRTYTNIEVDPIEALLTLPVPVHAAFFGLTATIGGVVHRGEARSKRGTRDRYKEALQEGKVAVLHEELLRGVHSLSLGKLGPGDSAEVTMRWAEVLRCTGPVARLRVPMTVGQVYGWSGPEDGDEMLRSGRTLFAELRVEHDARDVRIEGPSHGAYPDTEQPRRRPSADATLVARVPTDAPVDLRVDDWRSGEVAGRRWDGRPVALGVEPAGHGDEPLDVAVLLDRSGSMAGPCDGSGKECTKHQAAVDAIASLGRQLRPDDRIALWQFDTSCEAVGPEQPGPVEDVPALVEKFGQPRGATEIGNALGRCMARAGVRDVLLLTDGKHHALDPHALARDGGRVFVVLVGKDSLEANVGHLAALTGGDLRFAVGTDARRAMADIVPGLRTNAESPTPGNVRIETIVSGVPVGSEAPVAVTRSVLEEAVGTYAAYLRLAKLDPPKAAELAAHEGLVTHLTSLCIVDENGVRHEGLPEMRKLGLASPRVGAGGQSAFASSSLGNRSPLEREPMHQPSKAMSTAAWRRGRGAPTPWMMRPVLPPLEEYGAVPSFRERSPLDARVIRALWHQHMSGSPVRMDPGALRMQRWMRIDGDGVLTPDEETALHDFFEALRGIDLFAFRQSCGASIYEIARVMDIIECRAHYAVGWMRQYLYEDWDDEWRAG